jgi:hypothetical protein
MDVGNRRSCSVYALMGHHKPNYSYEAVEIRSFQRKVILVMAQTTDYGKEERKVEKDRGIDWE